MSDERIEGAAMIMRERLRQVSQEGWTPEHDDEHSHGELAKAAAVYAIVEQGNVIRVIENPHGAGWPWERQWFKPFENNPNITFPCVDRIRCLVKAGALIAAEIDRLQRLEISQNNKHDDEQSDDEITISITAQQLLNRGIWMEACTLLGINEWAVKEGLMDYNHKIEMTESQAKKLGII